MFFPHNVDFFHVLNFPGIDISMYTLPVMFLSFCYSCVCYSSFFFFFFFSSCTRTQNLHVLQHLQVRLLLLARVLIQKFGSVAVSCQSYLSFNVISTHCIGQLEHFPVCSSEVTRLGAERSIVTTYSPLSRRTHGLPGD